MDLAGVPGERYQLEDAEDGVGDRGKLQPSEVPLPQAESGGKRERPRLERRDGIAPAPIALTNSIPWRTEQCQRRP